MTIFKCSACRIEFLDSPYFIFQDPNYYFTCQITKKLQNQVLKMFDPSKADQADKSIRKIRNEVLKAEENLKMKIERSQTVREQIFQKQNRLQDLNNTYQSTEYEYKSYKDKIDEINKSKEHLQAQNNILYQLIAEIKQDTMQKSRNTQHQIPENEKNEIVTNFNYFIENLQNECRPIEVDELLTELNQVKSEQRELQKEIEIMKSLNGNWDPVDDMSLDVEDVVQRISIPPEKSTLPPLSKRIEIPYDPSLLETISSQQETRINHTPEVITDLQNEIEKRKVLLNQNQSLYNEQINYLQRIAELSRNYYTQSHNQVKQENTDNFDYNIQISPITIPESHETTEVNDFSDFTQKLLSQLPEPTLFDECVEIARKSVDIQEITIDPPNVHKVTQASQDLAQLSGNLKKLKNIPKGDYQNIQTHAANQISDTADEHEREIPKIEQIDNHALESLLPIAEKISQNLSEPISSMINQADDELPENEEEEIIEVETDRKEKLNEFQSMLEQIISIPFPDESIFQNSSSPQETKVVVKPVDIPAMIEGVCQYLSPQQQNIDFMENEIIEFRKRMKLLDMQINSLENVELKVSDEEVASTDSQIRQLQATLDDLKEKLSEVKKPLTNLQKQDEEIAAELESLTVPEKSELVSLERELEQRTKEYESAKENADKEIQDYRELQLMKKMKMKS